MLRFGISYSLDKQNIEDRMQSVFDEALLKSDGYRLPIKKNRVNNSKQRLTGCKSPTKKKQAERLVFYYIVIK